MGLRFLICYIGIVPDTRVFLGQPIVQSRVSGSRTTDTRTVVLWLGGSGAGHCWMKIKQNNTCKDPCVHQFFSSCFMMFCVSLGRALMRFQCFSHLLPGIQRMRNHRKASDVARSLTSFLQTSLLGHFPANFKVTWLRA